MTSYGSREDWKNDYLPAPRATPREIFRLHLKKWEVLARVREVNENSPRAKPTCIADESPTELAERRTTLPVKHKSENGSRGQGF